MLGPFRAEREARNKLAEVLGRRGHGADLANLGSPGATGCRLSASTTSGTATMLLAAGQPPKVISEVLGHATVAFTMDVYTEVAEELTDAAMAALAAHIRRRSPSLS